MMVGARGKVSADRPRVRVEPRHKYLSIASCAMHQGIAYRRVLMAKVGSSVITLIIQLSLWSTIFASRSQVASFDWPAMQTYILLSFAINNLVSNINEARMFMDISSGDVVLDLVKPVDYLVSNLARVIGFALVEGTLALGVALAFVVVLPELRLPADGLAAFACTISVALGFLVKFLLGYLVALFGFLLLNVTGVLWARAAVTNVFSGAIVPLELFPSTVGALAEILPFRAIVHTPISLYLGHYDTGAIIRALAHQIGWVLTLWALARWLWGASVRRLVVQGG
jgi:ABC-2 type transport system permease protein